MAKQSAKSYGEAPDSSVNIISQATLIKGNINSNGDIRVDGVLLGDIHAKGRLVVGPNGKVEGEIKCRNIVVAGYIKGRISAMELLTMKSTAQIDGDIVVGKLSVEPGSLFTGNCLMENSASKDGTPQQQEQKKVG